MPKLANCGCVYHAEEGQPCVHDLALKLKQWQDEADLVVCACLDCLWLGVAKELRAQACPRCDGRVADWDSPEFTERLQARTTDEARCCPTCHNLCHTSPRLREGKTL